MEILLGAFSWLELEQHKEVQHLYDYYIKAHSSVTYLECQKFFLDNENSSGLSSSFFLFSRDVLSNSSYLCNINI